MRGHRVGRRLRHPHRRRVGRRRAQLDRGGPGQDLGRFSFRTWRYAFRPPKAGDYPVMARATNRQGMTQTAELIFNPPGYHNNVMQRIVLVAA